MLNDLYRDYHKGEVTFNTFKEKVLRTLSLMRKDIEDIKSRGKMPEVKGESLV